MNDNDALVPRVHGINLRELAGNDAGVWTLERLRFVTNYPNWSIATESLVATRNYPVGVSFASSVFLSSFDYLESLSADEVSRIQLISSSFLLIMFDKADMWNEYLFWFWFLRWNTKSYLRYDLHLLAHHSRDIQEFIDDLGDGFTWVHNMWVHNDRRRAIERKISRRMSGRNPKSDFHRLKTDLSPLDLRLRLEKVFQFFRFKFEQEAFWQSFWSRGA